MIPNLNADSRLSRAAQLFLFEERKSDSPYVEKIWRTKSVPVDSFISVAVSRWEIVVTKEKGRTYLSIRGPETKASIAPIPQDAEFVGIQFNLGAFMPNLPVFKLVDDSLRLPAETSRYFRLDGSAWAIPDYENAEAFVKRLVREGLLVRDPIVDARTRGQVEGLSPRSVQRRFLRATGLTQRSLQQIERAQCAVDLLDEGVPILDTVEQAGYADQAHLTRALKRFAGQTPSQILRIPAPG